MRRATHVLLLLFLSLLQQARPAHAAGEPQTDAAFASLLGAGAAVALHLVVVERTDLRLRPNSTRGQHVGAEIWWPSWRVDLPYWQGGPESLRRTSSSPRLPLSSVYAEGTSGRFTGTAAVVYGRQLERLQEEVAKDSTTGAELLRAWGALALPLADHISVRSQLTTGRLRGDVSAETVEWETDARSVSTSSRVPVEGPLFEGELALLRHFEQPRTKRDLLILKVGYRQLRASTVLVESTWQQDRSGPSIERPLRARVSGHMVFAGVETRPVTDWSSPTGGTILLPEGSLDLGIGPGTTTTESGHADVLTHTMRWRLGVAMGGGGKELSLGWRTDFWDVASASAVGPQWRKDADGKTTLGGVSPGTLQRSDNFLSGPYLRVRARF